MDERISTQAEKLFGKRRLQEILGQLWLDERRILERWARRGPGIEDLIPILLEWENRFRRDVEEGRFRRGALCPRERVIRFSELNQGTNPHDTIENKLTEQVREKF